MLIKGVREHWRLTVVALLALVLASIMTTAAIGSVPIPAGTVLDIVLHSLGLGGGGWSQSTEVIVMSVRLPRVVLGGLVGAALGVAGAMMQGLFKNPMADPYIIGISSGASVGAAAAIVFGFAAVLGVMAVPAAAFTSATATTFLVYHIARTGKRVPVETLLLSGIAVAYFLGALTSLIIYTSQEGIHQVVFWLMGGLWARSWVHVEILAPMVIVGVGLTMVYARDLNVMLQGEETAQHLGLDVESLKKKLLVLSALLTAGAVSVSGIIGFVGLVVPHIVRILVGPDHRILIPVSGLSGAVLLMWCDALARSIMPPFEIPVGIITAMLGAPFFIYLLRRRKRSMF
ncbi:MAG: FecCD family ABC transporter permease [Methermicoccaceae archaeon]